MQKNNFRIGITIGIALLFLAAGVHAQTKNEFSVKQCVDYGLKNSIQVKNALLDIKNQQQINREITAAALPQINGSGSLNHYYDIPVQPISDFISPVVYGVLTNQQVRNGSGQIITLPNNLKSGVVPVQFGTIWNSAAGITLNQILFDGQVFVALQARSTSIALYSKAAEVTQEQIKANIYKIYYQLAVGKKQLASVEANMENFEKLLHDTKEIFKNGFVEKLDVDKITVQLNNLQTQKEVVNNQLAAGNAGLKFLLNMPQKDSLILTDTLSEEELKTAELNTSFDYNNRKDIQLLNLSNKFYEYNIKRYQLSRIPTLTAVASYSKSAFGNDFSFYKGNWYATSFVGLNLSVPIFDGNARRAKIMEAKYAVEKIKNNEEQLKQAIDNDVAQARINMKSALATMENQKTNIQLAAQVFNTTRLKYNQGLGSNQEMYDAQTQLEVSQNNYYNALYDAIIAKINYLQATGQL